MLSLTAKLFITDVPDEFQFSVVHPPSWMISVEPHYFDRAGRLAYFDIDRAVVTTCLDLEPLANLLRELRPAEPGVDTARSRSYYRYGFWFALMETGGLSAKRVDITLNNCADIGREPEPLAHILAWLAERLDEAAPGSGAAERLLLWTSPPRWSGIAGDDGSISR